VPAAGRHPGGSIAGLTPWQNGGMKRATEDRQATPSTSRPALSRQRVTVLGRSSVALAAGLLATLMLTACTGGSPAAGPAATGPGTAAATEPNTAGSGTTAPSASSPTEDPATTAMKQTVTDALTRLAAGTPKPATAQVTEALTAAGVAAAALEVSASRTPTGLEADAIESAVLQGKDCVLGHIRDGSVTVTVLPVLASGKCFVGAAA
jgi:hypothetical protein